MSILRSAREWINTKAGRWVCVGATALCLGLAVVTVLCADGADPVDTEKIYARGHDVLIYCPECGHIGRVHLPYDATFPVACPACKKPKAVAARRCFHCGAILTTPASEGNRCPACKAASPVEDPDI